MTSTVGPASRSASDLLPDTDTSGSHHERYETNKRYELRSDKSCPNGQKRNENHPHSTNVTYIVGFGGEAGGDGVTTQLQRRVVKLRDTYIYEVIARPRDPEKPTVTYPYLTRHDAVGAAMKIERSHELLLGELAVVISPTYVERATVCTGPFRPTPPPRTRDEVPTIHHPDDHDHDHDHENDTSGSHQWEETSP